MGRTAKRCTHFGSILSFASVEHGGRHMRILDVENNVTLSKEYYVGWADGLVEAGRRIMIDFADEVQLLNIDANTHVSFLPCVYGHHNARDTWRALGKAVDAGAECHGSWLSIWTPIDFRFGHGGPSSHRLAYLRRFPSWPASASWTTLKASKESPSILQILTITNGCCRGSSFRHRNRFVYLRESG
jgi:hypothetical protein